MTMASLWRKAYDAVERPLAAGSETWIQSDTFMDLAALSLRVQRWMVRELQQNTESWLHLWGVGLSRRRTAAEQSGGEPRAAGTRAPARSRPVMAPGSPTLLERQFLRARNGFAYMTGANRPEMGGTPRDEIWKRDKARLWRYRSDERRYRPPVLIVHSLVSKSYILDLLPGTSMIRYLLEEGFDIFLLDWDPADPADAENTLETYVDDYLPEAIGALLEESGADELR